jgi:hypothetical protein
MPAQLTVEESAPNATLASLVQFISLATALLLGLLATWMLTRRLSGGLVEPLDAGSLLALSTIVAGSVGGLRLLTATSPIQQRAMAFAGSTTVVAIGIAFSLSGTTAVGLIFLWLPLIAEECLAYVPRNLRRRSRPVEEPSVAPANDWEPLDSETLPESVNQQWVRLLDESGKDSATGMIRAVFAPTERVTSVHLGFCPPFATTPELSIEAVDGEEATIQLGQVLPYGARIELRRRTAGEAGEVVLQFFAVEGDEVSSVV